jgi:hypothetical protein
MTMKGSLIQEWECDFCTCLFETEHENGYAPMPPGWAEVRKVGQRSWLMCDLCWRTYGKQVDEGIAAAVELLKRQIAEFEPVVVSPMRDWIW